MQIMLVFFLSAGVHPWVSKLFAWFGVKLMYRGSSSSLTWGWFQLSWQFKFWKTVPFESSNVNLFLQYAPLQTTVRLARKNSSVVTVKTHNSWVCKCCGKLYLGKCGVHRCKIAKQGNKIEPFWSENKSVPKADLLLCGKLWRYRRKSAGVSRGRTSEHFTNHRANVLPD